MYFRWILVEKRHDIFTIIILSTSPFDVYGISVDLSDVTSETSPVVWAIGVIRDPSIQFTLLSGDVQLRSSFYRINFTNPHDMVWHQVYSISFTNGNISQGSFFLDDINNALNASEILDDQILTDSQNISSVYGDLLSLVTRQAMSAVEITVSKNSDGTFNSSDIMAFMKNMGSIGASGCALLA